MYNDERAGVGTRKNRTTGIAYKKGLKKTERQGLHIRKDLKTRTTGIGD